MSSQAENVAQGQHTAEFLSTVPPGPTERRAALTLLAVIALGFMIAAPLAHWPVGPIPGFIAGYEAAIFITDLLTALLLMAQFARVGTAALLVLGAGYLFDS